MVRKVVRKRAKRVPAKSLPALGVRKKVRNQKPNLHQIRNRYKPIQTGNQHALKHGGYGLQMSDSLAGSVNLECFGRMAMYGGINPVTKAFIIQSVACYEAPSQTLMPS
ncbi:hypothetical protein [Raoultella ornithinolytica]|uniref:hypothetical protein n=1 Tax=Raoultella ornithinolytica TaxID=54291 RepID=UPI003AFAEC3D